jgi:hypothetical protein
MNTSTDVTLPPAQADELAELLDMLTGWLTAGAESALADLETHLDHHTLFQGGMFDTGEDLDPTEILSRFTTLIAAYQAMLDRPDIDEGDDW